MIISNDQILLSYLNTKLRDSYDSLDELVDDLDFDLEEIVDRMKNIGYHYDDIKNQFVVNKEN